MIMRSPGNVLSTDFIVDRPKGKKKSVFKIGRTDSFGVHKSALV